MAFCNIFFFKNISLEQQFFVRIKMIKKEKKDFMFFIIQTCLESCVVLGTVFGVARKIVGSTNCMRFYNHF
jgi:hypothetical protein